MINESQKKRYRFWFDMTLRNRDITIAVLEVHRILPVNGSPHRCDSDVDFFGEIDLVFDIYGETGRLTKFQQMSLDWGEYKDILDIVCEILEEERDNYDPD